MELNILTIRVILTEFIKFSHFFIVTSLTFPPEDYDHSVPEILSPIFTLFLMANIG